MLQRKKKKSFQEYKYKQQEIQEKQRIVGQRNCCQEHQFNLLGKKRAVVVLKNEGMIVGKNTQTMEANKKNKILEYPKKQLQKLFRCRTESNTVLFYRKNHLKWFKKRKSR